MSRAFWDFKLRVGFADRSTNLGSTKKSLLFWTHFHPPRIFKKTLVFALAPTEQNHLNLLLLRDTKISESGAASRSDKADALEVSCSLKTEE